jgi:hypothetical protein
MDGSWNQKLLVRSTNCMYRQSGWLCTRWGEIAQSLNFKYLYKNYCESNELSWAFKEYPIIENPQQFAGFAATFVKIFKV